MIASFEGWKNREKEILLNVLHFGTEKGSVGKLALAKFKDPKTYTV